MSQHPLNQESVAKDLHGVEWWFRHIFQRDPFIVLLVDRDLRTLNVSSTLWIRNPRPYLCRNLFMFGPACVIMSICVSCFFGGRIRRRLNRSWADYALICLAVSSLK
jgi:hypothetical protein